MSERANQGIKIMEYASLITLPVVIKITYFSPGRPAYTAGAPEDCYEEEQEKFDLEIRAADGTRIYFDAHNISDAEREAIVEEALEHARECR